MLSALALIPLIASVSAHTIFQELYVNGVSAGHKTGIRLPTSNSPIEDVDSASMACNVNPSTSTDIINIPAGSPATWEFHQGTEKSQYGTGDDPIAASHRGPILVYVAPVSNATTASAEGLKWTKIYEEGFDAATSTFAVDRAIANKGKVDFKVPACLASGHYLLRAEIIALHSAGQYPGAQFYMSCAQIQITGGGSAPLSGVSIPGAYKGSDAGVTYNLYYPAPTSYTIPGPSLFTCDGSGSDPVPEPPVSSTTDEPTSTDAPAPSDTTDAPAPPETTDAPAPPETTDAPAPPETTDAPAPPESTTIPTPVETAPGAAQTLYGPCGGINYKGPTSCPAGSICKEYNPWYSQCIAGSAGLQPSRTDASEPAATHYAQCGGASFSGVTKCAAGLTCKVLNPYYSQCL